MKINYKAHLINIDWSMVRALFDSVGWTGRDEHEIRRAFEKSSFVRFAVRNNEIVGCGRTVDDGRYYGWIVDLAIMPDHQKAGIGTQILKELSWEMRGFKNISLVASSDVVEFYRRNGWVEQIDATMRFNRERAENLNKSEHSTTRC